jgi:hypothetical protein
MPVEEMLPEKQSFNSPSIFDSQEWLIFAI